MTIAIIVAAGRSERFVQAGQNFARLPRRHTQTAQNSKQTGKKFQDKLIAPILGKPLIYYTIQALHDHPLVDQILIVANQNNQKIFGKIVKKYHFPKVAKIVLGGKSRQESVRNGILAAENGISRFKNLRPLVSAQTQNSQTQLLPKDIILVHNGANPFVTEKEISAVITAAKIFGAAAVGSQITDTIKEIKDGHYLKTHNRDKLIAAQTPQAAEYSLFKKALAKAKKSNILFTDETSLLENLFKNSGSRQVKHIPASENNFKITTFHDYERAKIILGDVPQNFLVGIGQDSHKFADQASVRHGQTLGGLYLKNCPKLSADSDGDVILHAIYNALSQAIGEGSLGRFATPLLNEKGIADSKKYLKPLLKKIAKQGCQLNNLGIMVECKIPKIDSLTLKLKKSLSKITGLTTQRIGITATSGDNLTSFGRGEGIQVFAIVSLIKNNVHGHHP